MPNRIFFSFYFLFLFFYFFYFFCLIMNIHIYNLFYICTGTHACMGFVPDNKLIRIRIRIRKATLEMLALAFPHSENTIR